MNLSSRRSSFLQHRTSSCSSLESLAEESAILSDSGPDMMDDLLDSTSDHQRHDSNSSASSGSSNNTKSKISMELYLEAIERACENWTMIRDNVPNYHLVVGTELFRNIFEIAPQAMSFHSYLTSHLRQKKNLEAIYDLPAFKFHCQQVIKFLEIILFTMLDDAAPNGLQQLGDALQQVGAKHLSYGLAPEHYKVLETALLRTLEPTLSKIQSCCWNDDSRRGWAAVIKFISKGMQGGALKQWRGYQVEIDRFSSTTTHVKNQASTNSSLPLHVQDRQPIASRHDGITLRNGTNKDEEDTEHTERERCAILRMRVIKRSEGTTKLTRRGMPLNRSRSADGCERPLMPPCPQRRWDESNRRHSSSSSKTGSPRIPRRRRHPNEDRRDEETVDMTRMLQVRRSDPSILKKISKQGEDHDDETTNTVTTVSTLESHTAFFANGLI